MAVLDNLEPKHVFSYFEEICAIPHGSGNTEKLKEYLIAFAKEHQLSYHSDEYGNVAIFKSGSKGCEALPPVILQGHMDMVCEKNYEYASRHDFSKDGLKLAVMDDYIYAKGTTLGGDDGIAVAYMLAVLSDKTLVHPPIEAVFTTDEEIGMAGAKAFDTSVLKGTTLINLDNEVEGEILTSSAGGRMIHCEVPVRYTTKSGLKYNIVICGLQGGHSGTEIDKCLGNANLLMGRLLHYLSKHLNYELCSINGGLMDNAIPREAKAEILISEKNAYELEDCVAQFEATIQHEYRKIEQNMTIYCESDEKTTKKVLTPKTKERIIFLLMTIPDGVQKKSPDQNNLVQTSSNVGIMHLRDHSFELIISIRSSVTSEKEALSDKMKYLTETIGGTFTLESDYPAWEFRADSPLREMVFDTYQAQFGRNPRFTGIHAGLECGVFYEKIKNLDMISFGPDIDDIHTPREKLSIESAKRTWEFLIAILNDLTRHIL